MIRVRYGADVRGVNCRGQVSEGNYPGEVKCLHLDRGSRQIVAAWTTGANSVNS